MQAIEFVVLATRLSGEAAEVSQRSALSRGYYGAFHVARQLVESCGIRFAEAAQAHQHVGYCMDNSKDDELAVAARKLKSLRLARNAADYELNDPRFQTRVFTSVQLAEVRSIIDCVTAAHARLTTLRSHIRAYARVVRLTLVGDD